MEDTTIEEKKQWLTSAGIEHSTLGDSQLAPAIMQRIM